MLAIVFRECSSASVNNRVALICAAIETYDDEARRVRLWPIAEVARFLGEGLLAMGADVQLSTTRKFNVKVSFAAASSRPSATIQSIEDGCS